MARSSGDRWIVCAQLSRPAETERRSLVIPFGGMVIDDVENDLDAGGVQPLHHLFELADLLPVAPLLEYSLCGAKKPMSL